MKIDFSFIIPVYNSGAYLIRCVDSILKENIRNIEIIIVDDGSTDIDTLSICDSLRKQHPEVFVYHKDNEGPYSSRLFGYTKAKGRYIFTPDSDDYFVGPFLKTIYSILEANSYPDIISFNIFDKNGDKLSKPDKYDYPSVVLTDKEKILDVYFSSYELNQSLCRKCFKKELINKVDSFISSAKMFEDGFFSLKIMSVCKNTMFLNDSFYVYDHSSSESLTKKATTFNENNLLILDKTMELIYDLADVKTSKKEDYAAEIILLLINYIKVIISSLPTRSEKKAVFKSILGSTVLNKLINYDINTKRLKKQKYYLISLKKKSIFLFEFFLMIEKRMNT